MIDRHTLDAMSELSIESVDKDQLKFLSDVRLSSNAPQLEKVIAFIEKIENPYCFLCGETPVRVRFTQDGKDINHALVSFIHSARQA